MLLPYKSYSRCGRKYILVNIRSISQKKRKTFLHSLHLSKRFSRSIVMMSFIERCPSTFKSKHAWVMEWNHGYIMVVTLSTVFLMQIKFYCKRIMHNMNWNVVLCLCVLFRLLHTHTHIYESQAHSLHFSTAKKIGMLLKATIRDLYFWRVH